MAVKEFRSKSQVLFSYLPDQTVDLSSEIWRVRRWRNPITISSVDGESLKRELIRAATPWAVQDMDSSLVNRIRVGQPVRVITVDIENGVQVAPFPRIWHCTQCKRVLDNLSDPCICGSSSAPRQLHFVGYHDRCGAIREPFIQRCPTHNQARVNWPGTASASEIVFDCPVCDNVLQRGLGTPPCSCGNGTLRFNVHRAASVFTPHFVVLVNPPTDAHLNEIEKAGGSTRALQWAIQGFVDKNVTQGKMRASTLRKSLIDQGLSESVVEATISAALANAEIEQDGFEFDLPEEQQAQAEAESMTVAIAMQEDRVTIQDLIESTDPTSPVGAHYRSKYRATLQNCGLALVDFLPSFPVLTGCYGYTRGSGEPHESRLIPFRPEQGQGFNVYGELTKTEALFVTLDPIKVTKWLRVIGFDLADDTSPEQARTELIRQSVMPIRGEDFDPNRLGHQLFKLIHSVCHRMIRYTALIAGIERSAISELLVPTHLGFFIYAASRGDFVLGGLQATFESELDKLLELIVHDESRCPLDPGCLNNGGACMACLHLGETACRHYNSYLGRDCLFGESGFFSN